MSRIAGSSSSASLTGATADLSHSSKWDRLGICRWEHGEQHIGYIEWRRTTTAWRGMVDRGCRGCGWIVVVMTDVSL